MKRILHSTTALTFAILLAGGSAALASGDKSDFVSGNSTFSDCGVQKSDYAILMTGDLEGCLSTFVESFKCKQLADYDLYLEKGREVFIGTLHGKQGSFTTDYTFDAAYAKGYCKSFDSTQEVGGGCIHTIRRGRGAFKNVEGVIKIIDVIAGVTGDPVTGAFAPGTGGNNFLYYGRLHFDHDD
jgi:hypothetical protein